MSLDGLSTIDLMSMSSGIRRITRIMLRKRRISHDEMVTEIAQLPEEKRLSEEELNSTIQEMLDLGWMFKEETEEGVFYDVQMKKKEGSGVTHAVKPDNTEVDEGDVKGSTITKLWDAIDTDDSAENLAKDRKKKMDALQDDIGSTPEEDISDTATQKISEEMRKESLEKAFAAMEKAAEQGEAIANELVKDDDDTLAAASTDTQPLPRSVQKERLDKALEALEGSAEFQAKQAAASSNSPDDADESEEDEKKGLGKFLGFKKKKK